MTATLTANGQPESKTRDRVKRLVEARRGFILDVGCGANKEPRAVGFDRQALPGVDIIWDWNLFPWSYEPGVPIEDEAAITIVARQVVEHVSPVDGHFLRWMDECWRILKPAGQLALAAPYGINELYVMDPTHCNPCNENTWRYFDPCDVSGFYGFYRPKPWKIEMNTYHSLGMQEVVLRKRDENPETWGDGLLPKEESNGNQDS